jgi:spore coat polysaccharide biosynthesis predicted glycosyltransferase SpsG
MKVIVFTEGGRKYGYGHVSRCKALCEAFIETGVTPDLIINGDETITHLLEDISCKLRNWLDNWTDVCENVKGADIVVIDSYMATQEIYVGVSDLCSGAVFIDDTNRIEYPQGILINGGFGWKDLNYKKCTGLDYLVGPEYIFLRKEFWNVPLKTTKETIDSVMITLGGTEIGGILGEIVCHLGRIFPNFCKHIVLGPQSTDLINYFKKLNLGSTTRIEIAPNAEKIKHIMSKCDVLISGGGQTVLEALAMGLPSIIIGVADNQLHSIKMLENTKVIKYAGTISDQDLLNKLSSQLEDLNDKTLRRQMSVLGQKLVDGKGARRIVNKLIAKALHDYVQTGERNSCESQV